MKKVSVIGIGRLGLCFSLTLASSGFYVVGHDIMESYVKEVNDKTFFSYEPGVNDLLLKSKNFMATINLEDAVNHSDTIFVTVASFSEEDGRYDVSQVEAVVESLKALGRQEVEKHLVICTNVNPGYSDKVFEKLKNYNWQVSFNPETVAQGTILKNQSEPDCVYIGSDSEELSSEIQEIYEAVCRNTPVYYKMDRLSAELTKVSLNCYLTCKISFANMIGDIATEIGADPQKVLAAVGGDSRINNKFFNYGFGWGGPCFPRDTRALIRLAKDNGVHCDMCIASISANEKHLNFQVKQFIKSDKKKYFTNSVTYKPNTTIIEESQQLKFALELANNDVEVCIDESKTVTKQIKAIHGDLFKYV